ncbi:MAG: hypothetical protein H6625_03585 [Bdellovibrionaceae bacterium]|nr:hypothetical protein [Pseudobdellovibrionaceae bacterium]
MFTVILNNGNSPATFGWWYNFSAFGFKNSLYPGTGGTSCTGTLNNGQSCTIVVIFFTISAGLKLANVQVTYNNGKPLSYHKSLPRGWT